MNFSAHQTPSSAAASPHAAATTSLELLEARQARDILVTLLRREHAAMAEFLLALSDFDRRRGWEPLGHTSLFAFLIAELRLSKGAAYVRSSAARLLLRFPEVIEPLRDGRLCLSSVGELARVATPDNFATALPRFFGCSSREAREVAAAILPREAPPVRDQVTRLAPAVVRNAPPLHPVKEAWVLPGPVTVAAPLNLGPPVDSESVRAHEPNHAARGVERRDQIEPLTADLRRLHVTVSREFLTQLEAARDGLSHALPGATTEQVLKAALDLLVEKQARARGQVKRPHKATSTPAPTEPSTPYATASATESRHRRTGSREHIPAAVRRAVWERDQARCTWPLDGGGVCSSTHRLEIDHRQARGLGGQPELGNLRLLCERHNKLAARLAYGERWMGRYAKNSSAGNAST
jgi:5-methylcytosine-specific restriction endonuclease McrA